MTLKKFDLSIIIVSYNTAHLLIEMFEALSDASRNLAVQVIVVDNASNDKSVEIIKDNYPDVKLITSDKNVGFARANILALPLVQAEFILLSNVDTFVQSETLNKTLEYMHGNPSCGVLGVKLLGMNGELQPSCRYFPTPWNIFLNKTGLKNYYKRIRLIDNMDWDHASIRCCDWVPGCFFMISKEAIEKSGFLDQKYFLYYEEVDLCARIKKNGWNVCYYPDTFVVHIGGESAKSSGVLTKSGNQIEEFRLESQLIYFRSNHGLSAVLIDVVLTIIADLVELMKYFIRQKKLSGSKCYIMHMYLVVKVLFNTRMGLQPVR